MLASSIKLKREKTKEPHKGRGEKERKRKRKRKGIRKEEGKQRKKTWRARKWA
jgi:hypothetical protein